MFEPKKRSTPGDARPLTYHEAGHAVVAHMLGYKVLRVSIAPKAGSYGHVSWRDPINRRVVRMFESGSEADLDSVRHRIDHAIIVRMAGALAQKRHNPRSGWRYGGSGAAPGEFLLKGSDDQQALELASRVHEGEKVRAAYMRYLEARAEALVKRYWSRIEQLAITLLERETGQRRYPRGHDDGRDQGSDLSNCMKRQASCRALRSTSAREDVDPSGPLG